MSLEPPDDPSTDPRSSEELIALALSFKDDMENDALYPVIRVLQFRLRDIVMDIVGLAHDSDPRVKEIAAMVMGQNSIRDKVERELCGAEILLIIIKAIDEDLLTSALYAFKHIDAPYRPVVLRRFLAHPSAKVRLALAFALGGLEEDEAIKQLIWLSRDPDYEVRNWATFGLGDLTERDTPEIRDALAARLDEEEEEAHGEALLGLVIRRDPRAIEPLLKHLHESTDGNLISLVWDCLERLIEFRNEYPPEWTPVFETLAKKFPDYKGPSWLRQTDD